MANFEFNPDWLARAAEALFGPAHSRAGLAEAMGISQRTAMKWLAGEWVVSTTVYREVLALVAKRVEELQMLHVELTKAVVQAEAHARDAGFAIGDLVEGGEGEDHDVGKIIAYLDPPVGECDVLVAWDSGVRTPAVSAELSKR